MIELDQQNSIAIIKMNHPPANAINATFLSTLNEAVTDQIASDSKAIILTGNGNIFSAGVDLVQLLEGGAQYIGDFLVKLEQMLETLFFCPKPLIAAINGHAIAGGCVIACCADRRLMVDGKARIGVPELRVGVPFPVIIMELMRAKVSSACFEEIMLGGASYLPKDAAQKGLVDEIIAAEDLMEKALDSAESLASIRPEIYSFTKTQIRQPIREIVDSKNKIMADDIKIRWESKQTIQAITKYVEKTLKK